MSLTTKIALIGEAGTGKSQLMYRMAEIPGVPPATIGVEFVIRRIGDRALQFWDTAGTERYQALSMAYLRNIDVVLIVYDIGSVQTANRLDFWHQRLIECCNSDPKIIIVANKSDLSSTDGLETGLSFALEHNYPHYIVSARNDMGTDKLLTSILAARGHPTVKHSTKKTTCCRN